jgi:hypothetical protein
VPFAAGQVGWLKVTLDIDNGAAGYDVKFYWSLDGVTWTQLGTTVTTAGVTTLFASAQVVIFGRGQTGTQLAAGKFVRAIVKNGIDGPTVLDVDCSQIASGSATSFTALTGQTVTIVRGSSSRKSVAVVAPVWLFGTDDYMEVPDNALLGFGASDSFTAVVVNRQPSITVSQVMLAKKSSNAAANAGWAVRNATTGTGVGVIVADGVNQGGAGTSTSRTAGVLDVIASVFPGDTDAGITYINGAAGAAGATVLGSIANADALRVGRYSGAGTSYADMEFVAAAIFRRALSLSEINTLTTYFQGRCP